MNVTSSLWVAGSQPGSWALNDGDASDFLAFVARRWGIETLTAADALGSRLLAYEPGPVALAQARAARLREPAPERDSATR